ncbi:D-alanyl-D-alanine carboxypeptidase [Streptomyces sp. MMG1121]|uniref:D-alanyl-D-alanine carboxypeptidase n=1 Tax=Streptomyces sp. MMG1121 TaxID=1415544 RepID=UPI0006C2CBE5|nr:D-alanyl-D-alanine carboxypeptidase [Streptomyces sp. MMG1121]KOV66409.1 D-alanyl-D-alanine carboxypeptidase [Streptomyces sp. MMG1121]
MEEASVAGESPDRSKQRESSAEPTPGSGDSVPEARDPRLAVSREKDSSGGGGVDTATKVLSVRDVAAAKAEESADAKVTAAAEDRETTEEDAALREAVSAWVRGADGKTSGKQAEPKPETETESETVSGAGEKEEAASGAEAGADADASSVADAKEGTAAATEAEADVSDEAGAEADADAAAEADAETGAGAEAEAEADAETSAGAEAEAEAEADAETGAGTDADTGAGSGAEAEADADTRAEADADEKADGGAEAEAKEDAEAGADENTEGKADTAAEADSGPEAKADADAAPEADADTDAEAEADAGAEADAKAGRAGSGDGGAEAAVDQPTAVFKAVRPKVDQPTTMLKLGGTPKSPKAAESDSERTSKFVALKPDLPGRTEPKDPTSDVTTAVPQVGPERTTQQPLPPRPPLDLLAELTNTPPPPETPVRTIVRRVKIWTPLVLLLAVVFVVVQAMRPLPSPALALTAKDSYTFDGGAVNLPWPGEGQGWMDGDGIGTMGRFGKQTPVAIGSVAKTMTSYIILRDHPLKPGQEGPKIKVDKTAEKEGGYDKSGGESTLNTVKAGDFLTEKQALSAVMIPSANNIARLLARWDAGSEAAFVKKMNATAKELGMTNTTYTDPSGLTPSTVSTAEDQVKLGRAVVKNPALVAITSAASWTDPSGHNWTNVNTLPYLIGAIGIKTGSTTAAGGNLLFASRKTVGGQTVTVVGAILGQHKGPSILDTVNAVSKTALLAAQNALTSEKILKKGDVVGYVDDQLGGQTPIVVTKDVTAVGWSGLKVKLSFASDSVPHTAKAGTRVGTLTVGDGSAGAVKVPVALQKDLAEPGFGAKLTRLS